MRILSAGDGGLLSGRARGPDHRPAHSTRRDRRARATRARRATARRDVWPAPADAELRHASAGAERRRALLHEARDEDEGRPLDAHPLGAVARPARMVRAGEGVRHRTVARTRRSRRPDAATSEREGAKNAGRSGAHEELRREALLEAAGGALVSAPPRPRPPPDVHLARSGGRRRQGPPTARDAPATEGREWSSTRRSSGESSATRSRSCAGAGSGGDLLRRSQPQPRSSATAGTPATPCSLQPTPTNQAHSAPPSGRPSQLAVRQNRPAPRNIVSVMSRAITFTTCFFSMAMSESRTSSGPLTSRTAW